MAGTTTLAHVLGWFSIGLGLAEVTTAEALGKALGMEKQSSLIRLYGLRELAAGIGILAQPKPSAGWLLARVAGDGTDLATLASAHTPNNPKRGNVTVALAAVAGVTLLDILCAEQLGTRTEPGGRARLPVRTETAPPAQNGGTFGHGEVRAVQS